MAKRYRDAHGRMYKSSFIEYRRDNTEIIGRQSEREVENRHKLPNLDTIHRIEIQNKIESLLIDGKGKIEILKILNDTYPDSKLSKYFLSYIENKIKYLKKRKGVKEISRDDD